MGFSYCIYRFLNKYKEVIYIGKAKKLDNRLRNHNHLPLKCYRECEYIEYIQFKNESDIDFAERYFISKYKPKYNTFMVKNSISFNILEFDELYWETYMGSIFDDKLNMNHTCNNRCKIPLKKNSLQIYEAHKYYMHKKIVSLEKIKIQKVEDRKIVDVWSGREFKNFEDASKFYNVSLRDIYYQINTDTSERVKLNKTFKNYNVPELVINLNDSSFGYMKPKLEYYDENRESEYTYNRNRFYRKIMCIDTGDIYDNVAIAVIKMEFPHSGERAIINTCLGLRDSYPTRVDEPLHWKFVDNNSDSLINESKIRTKKLEL